MFGGGPRHFDFLAVFFFAVFLAAFLAVFFFAVFLAAFFFAMIALLRGSSPQP